MPRPKRNDPLVFVGIRVPTSWLPELDTAAIRRDISRSEFLRRALRRVLDAEARQPST